MLRNLLFTLSLFILGSLSLLAQQGSGTLQGKVLDKDTREPIPFANVVLELGGTQIGGATSDFDGNYTIKPITPGKYDLKASYVGYRKVVITDMLITANKIRFFDIEMTATSEMLEEVEIIEYTVPLFDKDNTVQSTTITQEEINKMPVRNANAIATTVGGVFSADGERGNVRGQRDDATATFIDGVRVIGNSNLPQTAIEQVEVVLGGVPAQYGDVTGGIINITTRGPSRTFGAGIELETSTLLDAYGYNRASLSFMGPLIKGKERADNTALFGFFIAGEFESRQDGNLSAVGYYHAEDSYLNQLRETPLRPSGSGRGTFPNGEFTRAENLVYSDNSQNTSRYNINVAGNLNVRTSDYTNLTFGGSFNRFEGNLYSRSGQFFNADKNPARTDQTWRVFGRFSQRFPSDPESSSLIKNFYYNIQVDYTQTTLSQGDPDHNEDVFRYGYLGAFNIYKTPTFETGSDTVNGKFYENVQVLNSWDFDTLVEWNPADINPYTANYTTSYFDLFAGNPAGNYENLSQIQLGGGLLNGDVPDAFYGLYQVPGAIQTAYQELHNTQFSVNLSGSLDIGNHEVKLGFMYEQRRNSNYFMAPTQLWQLMRGYTNFHLLQLDQDNPYVNDPNRVDTIFYPRLYDGNSQQVFDISLRNKLGLDQEGLDFIVLDSYDFNTNTIQYYDATGTLITKQVDGDLFSLDMFSPDELYNGGNNSLISYSGYDHTGKRVTGNPSFEDFFNEVDENGVPTRPVAPYQPNYIAGYIQDKFAFRDLVFNVGLRVDRFDANQQVMADPYLLFPAHTAGDVRSGYDGKPESISAGDIPQSIGNNYTVYVDNIDNPGRIVGFRSENTWFNAEGGEITSPDVLDVGSGVSPLLVENGTKIDAFKDYDPQVNVMPRIAFSFPISDEAVFMAHYNVLTQRPTSNNFTNPYIYYYFEQFTGTVNNPALNPTQTINYELGFSQKLTNTSALTLTAFYSELRNLIQSFRYQGAYPRSYTSYSNFDFGTVKGLTLEYDLRRTGNIRMRASYTLQFADATGASPTTAASLLQSGFPNLRSTFPVPWDRRHNFTLMFDFRFSEGKKYNGPKIKREKSAKAPVDFLANTGFNLTATGGSGTPYTSSQFTVSPITGGANITESGTYFGSRLPWQFRLDLRVDKDFKLNFNKKKPTYLNVFFLVLNLLDTKNAINVYSFTGIPSDDGYLTAPEWQRQIGNQLDEQAFRDMYGIFVNNPDNYSQPRQVRVGLIYNF